MSHDTRTAQSYQTPGQQRAEVTSIDEYKERKEPKERKDPFGMLFPSFTTEFGERGASVIQKLFCLVTKQNVREGRVEDHLARRWVRVTAKQWGEKLGIKPEAARRAIAKLTDCGVLLAWNWNSHKYDRSYWYTLDLEVLQAFVPLPKQWQEGAAASDPTLEVWSPFLTSENSIPRKGGMEAAEVRSLYDETVLDVCENIQTAENVLTFSNSEGTEAEKPEPEAEPEPEAAASDVQQIAEEIGKAVGGERVREAEPSPAPEAVQMILDELQHTNAAQTAQLRLWTERRDVQQLPVQVLLQTLNAILHKRDTDDPVLHFTKFAKRVSEKLYTEWREAEAVRQRARECSLREQQQAQEKRKEQEEWKVTSPSTCNLTASVKAIRECLAVGDKEGASLAAASARPEPAAQQPGAMAA